MSTTLRPVHQPLPRDVDVVPVGQWRAWLVEDDFGQVIGTVYRVQGGQRTRWKAVDAQGRDVCWQDTQTSASLFLEHYARELGHPAGRNLPKG